MTKRTVKRVLIQTKMRIQEGDLARAIELLDEAISNLVSEGLAGPEEQ